MTCYCGWKIKRVGDGWVTFHWTLYQKNEQDKFVKYFELPTHKSWESLI